MPLELLFMVLRATLREIERWPASDLDRGYHGLKTLGLVCRAWRQECARVLYGKLVFSTGTPASIRAFRECLPPSDGLLCRYARKFEVVDLDPNGSASFLSGINRILPRLSDGVFKRCSERFAQDSCWWRTVGALACFKHVSRFRLDAIAFSSSREIFRLLNALPELKDLTLEEVTWKIDIPPAKALLPRRCKLEHIVTSDATTSYWPFLPFLTAPHPLQGDQPAFAGLCDADGQLVGQLARLCAVDESCQIELVQSWHKDICKPCSCGRDNADLNSVLLQGLLSSASSC